MQLDLQPGRRIDGKYLVKQVIGQGGMGAVYLVHHEVLGVDRALKVIAIDLSAIDGDDDEAAAEARAIKDVLDRFARETKTLARFAHPNIIYATDGGTINTTIMSRSGPREISYPYLVMEYCAGADGKRWAVANNPSLERIRSVCLQLAEGLACAHGAGVLHRDLKPQNVIITSADTAKILDFGLAKDEQTTNHLTQTGSSLGTLAYLAPEYLSASTRNRKHTQLTDLWGLGCCFYFFLTHMNVHPSSPEEGELEFYQRVMKGRYVPLDSLRTDISQEFGSIVRGLLTADPAKRTQSAEIVVQQLRSLSTVRDPSAQPFISPRQLKAIQASTPTTSVAPPAPAGSSELLFSEPGLGSLVGSGSGNVFASSPSSPSSSPSSSSSSPSSSPSSPSSSSSSSSSSSPSSSSSSPSSSSSSMMPAESMLSVAPALPAIGFPSSINVDASTKARAQANSVDREMQDLARAFDMSEPVPVASSSASVQKAPNVEPGQKTLMRMLVAEVDGAPGLAEPLAAPAATSQAAPPTSPSSQYVDEDKPTPSGYSAVLPAPTFGTTTARASAKETAAKKTIVLPAAIAGAAALLGITVFATFGLDSAPTKSPTQTAAQTSAVVDAERAQLDADKEMRSLEDERRKAAAEEKQRQALMAAALGNPRPAPLSEALPPPPGEPGGVPLAAAPAPAVVSAPRNAPSGAKTASAGAPAAPPASAPPAEPASAWSRFGTHSSNTAATAASTSPTSAASTGARRAGTRIPVRVAVDLVSQPSGPVIATVTQATNIGDITLAPGTEIHGTTSGSSGTRLMITFSSAIVNGANISLSGSALGLDGKSGIPGQPSGADGTDILAGAAGSTVGAVGAALSQAVGGVPGAAVNGATSPAASNTGRVNTSQTTVSTKRGARFLIYLTK